MLYPIGIKSICKSNVFKNKINKVDLHMWSLFEII